MEELKIFGSLCKQVLCHTGKLKDTCASRNYKIIIASPQNASAKVVFTKK